MKKKSWSDVGKYFANLTGKKKMLKRQRSKARRQSEDFKGFEKTTGAWDLD
ncbi:hypothetical protein SPBRAN_331 [uncultured Candidatus Thioglobus sp.]|nr:hypothetical protein SPBRAN_331 [uncultured Candidatus Thioglobus sp.]